jgi:hypothetical protein
VVDQAIEHEGAQIQAAAAQTRQLGCTPHRGSVLYLWRNDSKDGRTGIHRNSYSFVAAATAALRLIARKLSDRRGFINALDTEILTT